ncbi:MAG: hypothetical protein N2Z74_03800, partial [Syntrophales bacterium]|nr:hypothetical protein [Syntrophales bacterium]
LPQGSTVLDRTDNGLRIRVMTAALFPKGKSDPLPTVLPLLDIITQQLAKGGRVVMETTVECRQAEGISALSSWELAAARAETMQRRLLEGGRIAPDMVKANGTGRSCLYGTTAVTSTEEQGETTIYLIR